MRHILLTLCYIMTVLVSTAHGAGVDNSLYANVLEKYVKDGLVDYASLKAHRENLDSYLNMMGKVEPGTLSRNDQLAFYINLYNAATLKLIIDKYPVKSIKDIGSLFSSPWKLKTVLFNRKMVSLDHIEHDIVRPVFKDPRVHFVLNCSAMSCPPLLGVPYEGDMIDIQLELATEFFINDGNNNYLKGKTLYVSKIFDWFSEDFPDDFIKWFTGYARGELKATLGRLAAVGDKPKVKYLKYDWSLNRQPR